MPEQTAFKTKPKRTYRMRTVQCYRCGTNQQRQMVKPPIYCDECRNDVRFYERHPEQVDPVDWHIPGHRPNPDVRELSPVQEAAVAALAARSIDDTQQRLDAVNAEIRQVEHDREQLEAEERQIRVRMRTIAADIHQLVIRERALTAAADELADAMYTTEPKPV